MTAYRAALLLALCALLVQVQLTPALRHRRKLQQHGREGGGLLAEAHAEGAGKANAYRDTNGLGEAEVSVAGQLEHVSQQVLSGAAAWEASVRRHITLLAVRPQTVAGLLFCMFFVVRFLVVALVEWPQARQASTKRQKVQKAWYKFCHGPVQDMMGHVDAMHQSPAFQAQVHFQERHRDLMRFCHDVQTNERFSSDADPAVVEHFGQFMALWLQVFERCSVSPDRSPTILCEGSELQGLGSVAKLAKRISEKAVGALPDLGGHDLQEAGKLHHEITKAKRLRHTESRINKSKSKFSFVTPRTTTTMTAAGSRKQGKDPFLCSLNLRCVNVDFLSVGHALEFASLVAGCVLAFLLHLWGEHAVAACVDGSVVLVVLLLAMHEDIQENRRLDSEIAQLTAQKGSVKQTVRRILDWMATYDKMSNLWQYQTVHMLDLFTAVSQLVLHYEGQEFRDGTAIVSPFASAADAAAGAAAGAEEEASLASVLGSLSGKLGVILAGLGHHSLYAPSSFFDAGWLSSAAEQMQLSIAAIGEAAALEDLARLGRLLDCFFGLVVVRVMGAEGLPNSDPGLFQRGSDLTDAYVLLRLDETTRETAPRTQVVQDDLSPRWEEEFCLAVQDETRLTLEVLDASGEQGVQSRPPGIGFHRLSFRGQPGVWQRKFEPLCDMQTGKQLNCKLEFQYFFANCIKHLLMLDEEIGKLESIGAFLSQV